MIRRAAWAVVAMLAGACGGEVAGEQEVVETVEQRVALGFPYQASNTTDASDPNYSVDIPVSLTANETVMIGTCLINESSATGDTYLRLYDSSATLLLTSNDNGSGYGCGSGSKMAYMPSTTGTYNVRAGCSGLTSCQGTVAISRRKALQSFSAANTNNASIGTFNKQYPFNGGDVVRISTCGTNSSGATASGDTYLRLYNQATTTQVAVSDNASGCGFASEIVYQIPTTGYYQVRAGCALNTSCSGYFAVYVE